MECIVGYLKGKNLHGLIMRSPNNLRTVQYCDGSYATETVQCRSVSGMISSIGGLIVNCSHVLRKYVH